jgi:tetratricopeptide (TPR) repeat protein
MTASNDGRSALFDRYKNAEAIAALEKYGTCPDSSDDESTSPVAGPKDKKQRAKEKKEFMKAVKDAKKTGSAVDDTWQTECEIICAESMLIRGILQFRMNSPVKGSVTLGKVWGLYHALNQKMEVANSPLSTSPLPKDLVMSTKFGLGLFYTFLMFLPPSVLTVLKAAGVQTSDMAIGEEYLTEVCVSNTLRSPAAALALLTRYVVLPGGLDPLLPSLEKSKKVLDVVLHAYPANSYFYLCLNYFYRRQGNTAEAITSIARATENASTTRGRPTLFRCVLADTLFMDMQMARAKDLYTELLTLLQRSGESFEYSGDMTVSLAACWVHLGDDKSAQEWIKDVPKFVNLTSTADLPNTKYAAIFKAEPRLITLLPSLLQYVHRDLECANTDCISKNAIWVDAAVMRQGAVLTCPEGKALYMLVKSVMQKAIGEHVTAKAALQDVVAMETGKKGGITGEGHALPMACYELAEMEFQSGNHKRAKELLEKANKCKAEGLSELLGFRSQLALRQLSSTQKK